MSNLANIVYVLIVATVTTTFGSLSPAERVFNDAVELSITRVKNDYESAKFQLDALITQIESASPQQPESSSISAECFEFLRKRAMANRPQMIECSKSHLKSMKDQHNPLNATLETTLEKIVSLKNRAESCVSWLSSFPYAFSADTSCYVINKANLPAIVEGAKSQFSAVIENAKKVVNAWIPDAGHCIARVENPMPMMEWFHACKKNIERQDIGNPTGSRVVYH